MAKTTRILYISLPDVGGEPMILPDRLIARVCMRLPIDFPKKFHKGIVHRIEVPKDLTADEDIFNYVKAYNLINP